MGSLYAAEDPPRVQGVNILPSDAVVTDKAEGTTASEPPVILNGDEVLEWFSSYIPHGAIRLLSLQQDFKLKNSSHKQPLPFTQAATEHAAWGPDSWLSFTQARSGICTVLLDEPWRFILRSPDGPGPSFTLISSRRGILVKGIYIYDDPSFHPTTLLAGETVISGWRKDGLQIISLPQALAKAEAGYISTRLYETTDVVEDIELQLLPQSRRIDSAAPAILPTIGVKLQTCSTVLIHLERRARFQAQIIDSVQAVVDAWHRLNRKTFPEHWPPVHALRSQSAPWKEEFDSLAKRIVNSRAAITTILQQWDAQLNLEIAESSGKMTEVALQEAASMKTIAILTMVFLPGTAVASFFSMSTFDFSAGEGSQLSSKWLWIFFAVAAPMTIIVMVAWCVLS